MLDGMSNSPSPELAAGAGCVAAGAAAGIPNSDEPPAAAGGGASTGTFTFDAAAAAVAVEAVVIPANISSADETTGEDDCGFATAAGDRPKISRSDDFAAGFACAAVDFVDMPLKMSRSFPLDCTVVEAFLCAGGALLTPPGPTSVIGPRSARGASPSIIEPAERASIEVEELLAIGFD